MNRWLSACRLLPLFAALMLVLSGCGEPYLSTLDPKGPVAESQFTLMKLSIYIMLLVCAVVFSIFAYVLIRYRKRPGQDGIPKQVEGNTKLEIVWTVIPIILLLILAVPTVKQVFYLAEGPSGDEDALKVKVTGYQYWWDFEYPDLGIRASQELYIPTGKKVYFEVTAKDVIHSFWVPALGGKVDATPGLTSNLWLQADEEGVYAGKCAELCGPSHALMDFKVVAVSPEEFDDWVAKMKAASAEPTSGAAQQGEKLFKQNCLSCHAVGKEGGPVGPVLTNVADRVKIAGILENNKENMEKWIANPQDVKPGNKMPAFGKDVNPEGLTQEEISALAEYLSTLSVRE
ncbi:cytochrome c oxidase subunit II [Bacillaceae bacterium]